MEKKCLDKRPPGSFRQQLDADTVAPLSAASVTPWDWYMTSNTHPTKPLQRKACFFSVSTLAVRGFLSPHSRLFSSVDNLGLFTCFSGSIWFIFVVFPYIHFCICPAQTQIYVWFSFCQFNHVKKTVRSPNTWNCWTGALNISKSLVIST